MQLRKSSKREQVHEKLVQWQWREKRDLSVGAPIPQLTPLTPLVTTRLAQPIVALRNSIFIDFGFLTMPVYFHLQVNNR
jgi:hypothetical protein